MKKIAIFVVTLVSGVSLSFAQSNSSSAPYGDVDPEGGSSCLSLSYNMRLGSRDASTNNEVSALQDFLNAQGYLTSTPTGYFGQATLSAAKKFQSASGLLNSGYVGALTRAKIKEVSCSGGEVVPSVSTGGRNGTLTISVLPPGCTSTAGFSSVTGERCSSTVLPPKPIDPVSTRQFTVTVSGVNPLEVKASFYLGSACSNYVLDWGDGTNSNFTMPSDIACAQVVPTEPFVKMHTYAKAGSYTVKFQTGGSGQHSTVVTVGDNNTCPDGNPPTGDGCIIRCPDGTTVVGRKCPTTPICPKPGIVAVCPGTSTPVPFNSQTCSWDWNACPNVPTVTGGAPTARITENPTLKLGYASGGESSLYGSVSVEISAGGSDLYVAPMNLTFLDSKGNPVYGNGFSSSMNLLSGFATAVVGDWNTTYHKIPAGKKATFSVATKGDPKKMFAGQYVVSLRDITVSNSISSGFTTLEPTPNKSNPVTIVGEVSPYITDVVHDATPQVNVTITGVRFHPTSNTVTIGNTTKTLPSFNGTSINTTLTDFGITYPGQHVVKVTHPTTGASNGYMFTVSNTPIGGASASVVGTPILKLAYALGATGGEASIDATYTVEIRAGNSLVTVDRYGVFNGNKGFGIALNSPNGLASGAGRSLSISVNGNTPFDFWTISPGKTATFTVRESWNPKHLFAGVYHAKLYSYDMNGNNMFADAPTTNALTIIGEVSPYISMVTVDDNNNVKVAGQRFDVDGNIITVDGVARAEIVKGDATNIYFNASAVGLTPGGHFLQIKNSQKGDSNQFYFVVNSVQTSLPDLVFENIFASPSTLTIGQEMIVDVKVLNKGTVVASPATWSADNSSGWNASLKPGGTCHGSTVLQPGQTCSSKYGYTWSTPGVKQIVFKVDPQNQIQESDENNNTLTISAEVAQPIVISDPFRCYDGTTLVNGECILPISFNSSPSITMVRSDGAPEWVMYAGRTVTVTGANLQNATIVTGTLGSAVNYTPSNLNYVYNNTGTQMTFTLPMNAISQAGCSETQASSNNCYYSLFRVSNSSGQSDTTSRVYLKSPPVSITPVSNFQVLTSSVKKLEQVYALSTTGAGTIALSAPATLSSVTEEIMNFTGLKRGANEVRVSRLKSILNTISPSVSIGCANLSTTNTLFGPTTEECVRIFQNLNELEPTGAIDEQTNKALNRVLAR